MPTYRIDPRYVDGKVRWVLISVQSDGTEVPSIAYDTLAEANIALARAQSIAEPPAPGESPFHSLY
jgi:hypothetical protein